jgi:hypothetical protein
MLMIFTQTGLTQDGLRLRRVLTATVKSLMQLISSPTLAELHQLILLPESMEEQRNLTTTKESLGQNFCVENGGGLLSFDKKIQY